MATPPINPVNTNNNSIIGMMIIPMTVIPKKTVIGIRHMTADKPIKKFSRAVAELIQQHFLSFLVIA